MMIVSQLYRRFCIIIRCVTLSFCHLRIYVLFDGLFLDVAVTVTIAILRRILLALTLVYTEMNNEHI